MSDEPKKTSGDLWNLLEKESVSAREWIPNRTENRARTEKHVSNVSSVSGVSSVSDYLKSSVSFSREFILAERANL